MLELVVENFWKSKLFSEEQYKVVEDIFNKTIGGRKLGVLVGLPGSGRSTVLRQVAYYPGIISEEFKERMKKLVWVVVDVPAEEELEKVWKESLYTAGFDDESFEVMVGKVVDGGKQIVLVVNSLDTLGESRKTREIWKRLITLYYRYPGKIQMVLGQGREEVDNLDDWLRDLSNYYEDSLTWWPMGGEYLPMKRRAEEVDKIDVGDVVVSNSFEVLWESCGEKSQGQLLDLMRGKNNGFSDYLSRTGVVKMEQGKWKLFSPLFCDWLKKMMGSKRPEIEEKQEKLWLGESDLSEELSYQEYEVLKLLWQKRGEVVVRNEVAEVLWPKDTEDKYSDWAIDQVMAKIRRKIGDLGENRLIKTIKGRGMILEK